MRYRPRTYFIQPCTLLNEGQRYVQREYRRQRGQFPSGFMTPFRALRPSGHRLTSSDAAKRTTPMNVVPNHRIASSHQHTRITSRTTKGPIRLGSGLRHRQILTGAPLSLRSACLRHCMRLQAKDSRLIRRAVSEYRHVMSARNISGKLL